MALEQRVSAETLPDVLLLASEMVSNVIGHAPTPLTLSIEQHSTFLRLTVTDGTAGFDGATAAGDDAESGRGLGIIDSLTRAWGVGDAPVGKFIWAEIDTE